MPKAPPADPLADLRAPESDAATLPPMEADDAAQDARAVAPADFSAEATPRIVAKWHADTTALGILHRGGTCGCYFLARTALGVTVLELDADEVVTVE